MSSTHEIESNNPKKVRDKSKHKRFTLCSPVVVRKQDNDENTCVQILHTGTRIYATQIKAQQNCFYEIRIKEPIIGVISYAFIYDSDVISPDLKFQIGDHVDGVGILDLFDDETGKWKIEIADDSVIYLSEEEIVNSCKKEHEMPETTKYLHETEKFKSGDFITIQNTSFEFYNGLAGMLTIYNTDRKVWQVRLNDVCQTVIYPETYLTTAKVDSDFIDWASESGDSAAQKVLVLDMDHTLLETRRHTPFPENEAQHDFVAVSASGIEYFVRKRPELDTFLNFCFEYFQVYVFTAAIEGYATPILDMIDPNNKFAGRFFRKDCTKRKSKKQKDIRLCCSDLSQVIFVDDSVHNCMYGQEGNMLPIPRYMGDRNDHVLQILMAIFWHAKDAIDVRKVIYSRSHAGIFNQTKCDEVGATPEKSDRTDEISFNKKGDATDAIVETIKPKKDDGRTPILKKKKRSIARKLGFAVIGSVFAHFCDPWSNEPFQFAGTR